MLLCTVCIIAYVSFPLLYTDTNCSMKLNIASCHVNSSLFHITVDCTYTTTTMATGYQVIAYLNILDQVHKIYTNTTTNCHTQVTVDVEERGLYLVSVIPLSEETGIIGSNVEYRDETMLTFTPGKLFILNS